MSMVINLVEDHNIYLCEGGPVYNGGVQPTPITYLTQWKIVGNSEVHTDPYLTSWKVSGNSVVDNNTILSCGDLGQDGKYHVKISNGVTIFDIPLTEPLRKVGDVSDKIEFANNAAIVTRNIATYLLSSTPNWLRWPSTVGKRYISSNNPLANAVLPRSTTVVGIGLCSIYTIIAVNSAYGSETGISIETNGKIGIYDADYAENETKGAFVEHIQGAELLYQLATPTTELINVSPFPVSPTDTYTSVNVTPYSAFEHTEHKEIWSCGEYNPIDGKYHILVQPQGGSIADIALTEPLRKVNNVADTIEFPSDTEGKALVTRPFASTSMENLVWDTLATEDWYRMRSTSLSLTIKRNTPQGELGNILCSTYPTITNRQTNIRNNFGIGLSGIGTLFVVDAEYDQSDSVEAFVQHIAGTELIYELATPTTELVDAPQIAEAESYSCVISQGVKAVSWSSFEIE